LNNIVNNIDVNERIYDPFADLYIIFGHSVKRRDKPFCVAVQLRENGKLTKPRSFKHSQSARSYFNAVATGMIEPEMCIRDPLIQEVYDWENNSLNYHLKPLSKNEAKALAKRVAEDYGFETPKINFQSNGNSNYYFPDTNEICLVNVDNLTLLHELAHALVEYQSEIMEREYINHSPQFVWNAIELYQKYAGIDLQYLVRTASSYNILGDMQAKHIWDVDIKP